MNKFNIILKEYKDKKNFILVSCNTLEDAKIRLKDMKKTDKFLQKYYNWSKIPEYLIVDENGGVIYEEN